MGLRNTILTLWVLSMPFSSYSQEQLMIWELGGGLELQFQSDVAFEFGRKEEVMFGAHLPGFCSFIKNDPESSLLIDHTCSDEFKLMQLPGQIAIASAWNRTISPDFIHLVYGAARLEWLRRGIFVVHAACIGNDAEGYTLLIGNPGSGKTTLTLQSVLRHGYQVFSGDKTLLKFNEHGLVAVAGTRTITIRAEDAHRWENLPKRNEYKFVDRIAFQLASHCYSSEPQVPIKRILLVGLNDTVNTSFQLSPRSALHTLYPFFLDKQQEDVLIEGVSGFLDGTIERDIRKNLAKNLNTVLETVPVYKVIGPVEKVSAFIAGKEDE